MSGSIGNRTETKIQQSINFTCSLNFSAIQLQGILVNTDAVVVPVGCNDRIGKVQPGVATGSAGVVRFTRPAPDLQLQLRKTGYFDLLIETDSCYDGFASTIGIAICWCGNKRYMGWRRDSALNLVVCIIRDCMCAKIQVGGHCSGTDPADGTAIQLECICTNADSIVVPVSGQHCVTEIQCVGSTQTSKGCLPRRISYLQLQFRRTGYRYIAVKANRRCDILSGRIGLVGRGSRID